MSLFSLAGKVALVTGAGRGIGRGVAEGMGAAGATVVCSARTRSQLDEAVTAIETAGGKAIALEMDMSDLAAMDAGIASVTEQCGPIDILFNNAGMNIRQPIVEVTEENYDQIMTVNLKSLTDEPSATNFLRGVTRRTHGSFHPLPACHMDRPQASSMS